MNRLQTSPIPTSTFIILIAKPHVYRAQGLLFLLTITRGRPWYKAVAIGRLISQCTELAIAFAFFLTKAYRFARLPWELSKPIQTPGLHIRRNSRGRPLHPWTRYHCWSPPAGAPTGHSDWSLCSVDHIAFVPILWVYLLGTSDCLATRTCRYKLDWAWLLLSFLSSAKHTSHHNKTQHHHRQYASIPQTQAQRRFVCRGQAPRGRGRGSWGGRAGGRCMEHCRRGIYPTMISTLKTILDMVQLNRSSFPNE